MIILTPEQIAEIKERADRATPGPWEVQDVPDKNGQVIVRDQYIELFTGWHHCVGSIETEMWRNAHLIAAARTDIPRLVTSHEEQTKRIAGLEGLLREVALAGRYGELSSRLLARIDTALEGR